MENTLTLFICVITIVTLGVLIAVMVKQNKCCKEKYDVTSDDCIPAQNTLKYMVTGYPETKCTPEYSNSPLPQSATTDCMVRGYFDYLKSQGFSDADAKTYSYEDAQASYSEYQSLPNNWWLPTAQGGMC